MKNFALERVEEERQFLQEQVKSYKLMLAETRKTVAALEQEIKYNNLVLLDLSERCFEYRQHVETEKAKVKRLEKKLAAATIVAQRSIAGELDLANRRNIKISRQTQLQLFAKTQQIQLKANETRQQAAQTRIKALAIRKKLQKDRQDRE